MCSAHCAYSSAVCSGCIVQAVLSTNDIKLGHIMKYSTERWSRKSGADSDFDLEPVTLGRRQHVVGFGQTQIFRPILEGIEFGQTQIHIFIPTILLPSLFCLSSSLCMMMHPVQCTLRLMGPRDPGYATGPRPWAQTGFPIFKRNKMM